MTLENAAYEFDLPNWGKVLVLSLEFAPRDETLDWAKKLMTSERFKNHKVILLTHSILRVSEKEVSVIKIEKYRLAPRNYAEAVLKKLADDSDNLKLVLCAHSGFVVESRFRQRIQACDRIVRRRRKGAGRSSFPAVCKVKAGG